MQSRARGAHGIAAQASSKAHAEADKAELKSSRSKFVLESMLQALDVIAKARLKVSVWLPNACVKRMTYHP